MGSLDCGLLNSCHSLADIVRLLKRDKESRLICGFSKDDMPGEDVLGRILAKLVKHAELFDEFMQNLPYCIRSERTTYLRLLSANNSCCQAYSRLSPLTYRSCRAHLKKAPWETRGLSVRFRILPYGRTRLYEFWQSE